MALAKVAATSHLSSFHLSLKSMYRARCVWFEHDLHTTACCCTTMQRGPHTRTYFTRHQSHARSASCKPTHGEPPSHHTVRIKLCFVTSSKKTHRRHDRVTNEEWAQGAQGSCSRVGVSARPQFQVNSNVCTKIILEDRSMMQIGVSVALECRI